MHHLITFLLLLLLTTYVHAIICYLGPTPRTQVPDRQQCLDAISDMVSTGRAGGGHAVHYSSRPSVNKSLPPTWERGNPKEGEEACAVGLYWYRSPADALVNLSTLGDLAMGIFEECLQTGAYRGGMLVLQPGDVVGLAVEWFPTREEDLGGSIADGSTFGLLGKEGMGIENRNGSVAELRVG